MAPIDLADLINEVGVALQEQGEDNDPNVVRDFVRVHAATVAWMNAHEKEAQTIANAELKRLAVPASVDSIPSSAMQEDHVSMGWAAGRKLRRALDGLTRVLAVEVMTAARGLELRAPLPPSPASAAAVRGGCARVHGGPH